MKTRPSAISAAASPREKSTKEHKTAATSVMWRLFYVRKSFTFFVVASML